MIAQIAQSTGPTLTDWPIAFFVVLPQQGLHELLDFASLLRRQFLDAIFQVSHAHTFQPDYNNAWDNACPERRP